MKALMIAAAALCAMTAAASAHPMQLSAKAMDNVSAGMTVAIAIPCPEITPPAVAVPCPQVAAPPVAIPCPQFAPPPVAVPCPNVTVTLVR